MNPVFWLLVIIAACLIWWGARGLFDNIGNFFLRKHDEMQDILNQEEESQTEDDSFDVEYSLNEFKKYIDERGNE